MKPALLFPDAEALVVTRLTELLAADGTEATVTVGVPDGWTPAAGDHLQVAWDGTPRIDNGTRARAVVRITAHTNTPTGAKALAARALALLTSGRGAYHPLTGILPARDRVNGADLASFTVRVTLRPQSLPPAGP